MQIFSGLINEIQKGFCLAFAGAILLGASGDAAHSAERRVILTEGADYYGFDYKTIRDVTIDACSQACVSDAQCKAFTYNLNASWCFLKNGSEGLENANGAVAGRIVEVATTPKPTVINDPASLGFVPEFRIREAEALFTALDGQTAIDAPEVLAEAARDANISGDFPVMRTSHQDWVVSDVYSVEAWTSFANVYWRSRSNKYTETRQYQSRAISGALQAYKFSSNVREKALSLELLARTFILSSDFRPALEAYKASLNEDEIAYVRDAYEILDAEHGFRMLDYSVDSDAADPRVCVQFSEDLDLASVEYTDYVRLDGVEPTATRFERREICISNLKHGETFDITLRAGLPSKIGESLKSPVDLRVYVRDRSPQISFSGQAYVLSRSHARGIPISTVNLQSVDVSIYRVADAAMSTLMRQGQFNNTLSGYEAEQLPEDLGRPVWSGALEVESALNTTTTTLMPVFRVMGDLEPGAYVVVAATPNDVRTAWRKRATQWFVVSDLGLSSLSADDGLHIFVRSLETTQSVSDVSLRLMARNGELLGTAESDGQGYAKFAPGLMRGTGALAPSSVIAETDAPDYALLDLSKTGFDLSDRGVEGRTSPGALDAFLTTERGVYRPGADVYITALLRDAGAEAVAGVPLTLIARRPDGVEYDRLTMTRDRAGGFAHNLALPTNALRGNWDLQLYADPDDAPLVTRRFLVEDFVPERMDFTMALADAALKSGQSATLDLDARYLFGAPAANLGFDGTLTISSKQPTEGEYRGYQFGLSDSSFTPVRHDLSGGGRTDATGAGQLQFTVPQIPQTTLPLEANITLRMQDGGGRPVEREMTVPVDPTGPMMGIRPLFDGEAAENSDAGFQIVLINQEGDRAAEEGVSYELLRLDTTYQWYRRENGSWGWERITRTIRIDGGSLDIADDQPTRLDVPVEWGRYRLELAGQEAVASIDFFAGWYVEKSAFDTPDALQIGLDKADYQVGETAQLRLTSERAGELQVLVANEDLLARYEFSLTAGDHSLEIPVEEGWGAGAYVLATLYHPMDIAAEQLPSRAIGVDWLGVDPSTKTLAIDLGAPTQMRPRNSLVLDVVVEGASEGPAHIVVSAVDEGILNLTRFQAPRPEKHYFAQRQLGAELRDLYGVLIEGLSGVEGRLRAGGDGATAGLSMEGTPPAEAPVALYSGIVELDETGRGEVRFDVPQFNGTLKVMAMAWSDQKIGSAVADVIVRDPVVITATLPRFLQPGDQSRMLVQFDNTDGPAGNYQFEATGSETVDLRYSGAVELDQNGSALISVPLQGLRAGLTDISLQLSGPDALRVTKDLALSVRSNAQPITLVENEILAPGGASVRKFDGSSLDRFVPGTASLSLAIGDAAGLNPSALEAALDRYAYRCSEQLTSRALPLLSRGDALRDRDTVTINEAIAQLAVHQNSAGSFGLWGSNADYDLWLDSYVTDFLSRADEEGFEVPERVLEMALANLKNTLSYNTNIDSDANIMAYALWVLARNGDATLGDLRYFADTKLDVFTTPMAKAQLASSLALYGEKDRAEKLFMSASNAYLSGEGRDEPGYRDFGSNLRDGAAILALLGESGLGDFNRTDLSIKVSEDRRNKSHLSTQELAWLLMAARASSVDAGPLDLEVMKDGSSLSLSSLGSASGMASFGFDDSELVSTAAIELRNLEDRSLPMQIVRRGVPADAQAPLMSGFAVQRTFYHLDGSVADLSKVKQNDRLVVVLTVGQTVNRTDRLLLVDPLPAGFEIENPNLISSGSVAGLDFLPRLTVADHAAFLDDRFVAGFNGKSLKELPVLDGSNIWNFAYRVRAVSPGQYRIAGTHVEDMYRPDIFGSSPGGQITVNAVE